MDVEDLPVPSDPPTRVVMSVLPPTNGQPSFLMAAGKSYKHQYANIYFIRLRIEAISGGTGGEAMEKLKSRNDLRNPVMVPRVLEVVKSQVCYIIGTVYIEMPLKPNVLEDIARDRSLPAPPPPEKIHSANDKVTLEDESGRIILVGDRLKNAKLVTGIIIGVLGMETASGDFEVLDICYPGMPEQPRDVMKNGDAMEVDAQAVNGHSSQSASSSKDEWIGVVSGLDVGSETPSDAQIQMLIEFLVGESGGAEEQKLASQVSRLIIAGDSMVSSALAQLTESDDRKARRYGAETGSFSSHPTITLSSHLLELSRAMPLHILPGPNDPSGTILPQQPFPRAMFGAAAGYNTFSCETNPTYLNIGCDSSQPGRNPSLARSILVNSGQPLDDLYKYLPSPPVTRLDLAERTLRWRHMAPTAPDTLWCYPYFTSDPFIMKELPDLYIIGGQPRFHTKLVEGEVDEGEGSQKRCRVVLVPLFAKTGI